MEEKVEIIEVGPRDGLQNIKDLISLEDKIQYVDYLVKSNVSQIELTSFVRPEKIPQLKDAKELFEKISKKYPKSLEKFCCLVPNERGMETALDLGVKNIAVFTSTSETFNQKNINCSIDDSLIRIKKVLKASSGMKKRGYISTAFFCPYEGQIDEKILIRIIDFYLENGVDDISLGDTIGKATPFHVKKTLNELLKKYSAKLFSMHFHDTYGMALANVCQSYEMGIRRFDAASGGLGGCPFAPGASGNLATEEIVYLFQEGKLATFVDLNSLIEASSFIYSIIKNSPKSKYLQACRK